MPSDPLSTDVEPAQPGSTASYGQRRLWFINQFDPISPTYNMQLRLRAIGALDPRVLADAIGALVRRHEVLRTRLVLDGDRLVQQIDDAAVAYVERVDVSDLAVPRREAAATRIADAFASRGFDLSTDLPLRALCVRVSSSEHVVVLSIHHAAADEPSLGIVLADLAKLYGDPAALAPPTAGYRDFADWQRRMLERDGQQHLAYWLKHLRGVPDRQWLPADRPAPERGSPAGARVDFTVPEPVVRRLAGLAEAVRATTFVPALAGFVVLLALAADRGDHADEVVLGLHTTGRPLVELERVVGYFGNLLVIRTATTGDLTFRQALHRVRETVIDALDHRDLPFELLVERLGTPRSAAGTPLVNVLVNVVADAAEPPVLDGVTLRPETIATTTVRSDLALYLNLSGDRMGCSLEYRSELFDHDTVAGLAERLVQVYSAVAADPDIPLDRLRGPVAEAPRRTAAGADQADPPQPYREPATQLERAICDMWRDLLRRGRVGADDDFFDLGGHSVLAIAVKARVEDEFGVTVPLRWCLDTPTPGALAAAVDALRRGDVGDVLLAELEWSGHA